MSRGYVVDTDVCVQALRGHEGVLRALRERTPSDLFVASMTLAELRYGALKSRDPAGNQARVSLFLDPIAVLDFDADGAFVHADIRWALRDQPIGERDLVIAAVARVHGLTLVTGNVREFGRVPGLSLESWAARS